MEGEKKWLRKALQAELLRCKDLVSSDQVHQKEDDNHLEKMRMEADKRRRLAEKRRAETD